MNFSNFLAEGGAALKTTQPITQEEVHQHLPKLMKKVAKTLGIGLDQVKLLGSAGKKPKAEDLSGDVDLAVEADPEHVQNHLAKLSHDGKTFRSMKSINVHSFAHPVGEKLVQVDLMPVASPDYAAWASSAHPDDLAQGLKGSHRNELMFAIAKYAESEVKERDANNQPKIVDRYFYDLQKGLMKGTQVTKGKSRSTINKTLVTDHPEKVTKFLFGKGASSQDVSTFDGALKAIHSSEFPHAEHRSKILDLAREGMKKKGLKLPAKL